MPTQPHHRSLNILFAFDGSQHSKAAIELLGSLPLTETSNVIAIGVLIPRESSNHFIMENALELAGNLLREKGFNTKTEIVLGNPAEKIIEFAGEFHPDLIVAGAKGLRHTLGIMLGGVVQQIVEYSTQPVLVVRAPFSGLKRILIVTDGSKSSHAALEYFVGTSSSEPSLNVQHFPLPHEVEVRVMNVLPPLPSSDLLARTWPVGPDMLPPIPPDLQEEATWLKEEENRGHAIVDEAINYLQKNAGIIAIPALVRGDAATEIIEYAKENEIDLIVAGSRGFSEMRSWLLGSVSRKLVHYAGCSVLIVKSPHISD